MLVVPKQLFVAHLAPPEINIFCQKCRLYDIQKKHLGNTLSTKTNDNSEMVNRAEKFTNNHPKSAEKIKWTK